MSTISGLCRSVRDLQSYMISAHEAKEDWLLCTTTTFSFHFTGIIWISGLSRTSVYMQFLLSGSFHLSVLFHHHCVLLSAAPARLLKAWSQQLSVYSVKFSFYSFRLCCGSKYCSLPPLACWAAVALLRFQRMNPLVIFISPQLSDLPITHTIRIWLRDGSPYSTITLLG